MGDGGFPAVFFGAVTAGCDHLADGVRGLLNAVQLDVAVTIQQPRRRHAGERLRLFERLRSFRDERDVGVAAGVEIEELADTVLVDQKISFFPADSFGLRFALGNPSLSSQTQIGAASAPCRPAWRRIP